MLASLLAGMAVMASVLIGLGVIVGLAIHGVPGHTTASPSRRTFLICGVIVIAAGLFNVLLTWLGLPWWLPFVGLGILMLSAVVLLAMLYGYLWWILRHD